MPETCTCGAQLPPDSLFCHKCGKPQREILAPEVAEPAFPPPVTVIPPPAFTPAPPRFAMPVSFRNPVALQIALFVGVAATLLMSFLPFVNWLAAGFFAVFFYRRKTHNFLNVAAGMHLGWITGLVMAAIWDVFFMVLRITGKLTVMFQEQIKNFPSDPYWQQVQQFVGSGSGLLIVLAVCSVFIMCLSMAGGALGAKIVGRD